VFSDKSFSVTDFRVLSGQVLVFRKGKRQKAIVFGEAVSFKSYAVSRSVQCSGF